MSTTYPAADDPYRALERPPYYNVVRRRYWPVVTITLLVVNFVFFGLEIFTGGFDNSQTLLNLGAAYGPYLRRGEYWRLVMPMFLHGGWLHILGNSYALYMLGPIMERLYGYGRYLTLYVISGIAGAYLSMTFSKNFSVGASGAIMGIAAAMVVAGYVHKDLIPPHWGRAFGRGIIPFILLNLAWGLSVHGIDNWGHVGGLAGGAILAFVMPPPRQELSFEEAAEPPSQAIVMLPLAVVIIAMAATAYNYRTLQNIDGLLRQGERFEAVRQFDREFQVIQQAERVAPRQELPHEAVGRFYLQQRKYDQAIPEFQEAIRLTEGDEDRYRLELGLSYELKGDPQKAQPIFDALLGDNPKDTKQRMLVAENRLSLADLYAGQKLYANAIKSYQQTLKLAPDMPEAHNDLAWLLATCEDPSFRDPKAALEHAQRAVALTNWKNWEFVDTLSESYFANQDYEQAVETQEKALALSPDNKELQEHMARYRKAAGS